MIKRVNDKEIEIRQNKLVEDYYKEKFLQKFIKKKISQTIQNGSFRHKARQHNAIKKFNNSKNSRKLIDYGLMKKIVQEFTDYLKLFSLPILFKKYTQKQKLLVSEFMDIYSFILTIVFIEYGKETITLKD